MKSEKINLTPYKEFFIMALTKDVELDVAICDLIDNSINAAKNIEGLSSLKGYYVEINIKKDENYEFLINDNCGGITRERAVNKAFRLGNNFKEYTSGFGIGMKRSLFKIAEYFELYSCTEDDSFKIEMDMKKWTRIDEWSMPIHTSKKSAISGVSIRVGKLNPEIRDEILSAVFRSKLEKLIKIKYKFILDSGFKIWINNKEIIVNKNCRGNLLPERKYDILGNELRLIIENRYVHEFENYGWNFVINGFTIVSGDKTSLSNWGESTKDIRYNYEKFIGYVIIDGCNISTLPINTTKNGLDINSSCYKKILLYINGAIEKTRHNFITKESSIQYKMPIKEIEGLKKYFNRKTNADVGRDSFKYCESKFNENK